MFHCAYAPQNAVCHQFGRHYKIKRGQNPQELPACHQGSHRFLLHKQKEQISAKQDVKDAERNAQQPHHFQTCMKAFPDASVLAGAQILCRKVRNAVPDCGEGGNDQIIQLYCSRIACHDRGAEAIDHTLNHNISYGDKALLQNAGNGDH